MTGLIPAPRSEWTEDAGKAVVNARAEAGTGARTCEVTGTGAGFWPLDWSHRIAAGRGGTYAPSNGILLTRLVHDWAHREPSLAERLGWHLPTGTDTTRAPAWLVRPWPGFWLLPDDAGPLRPAHREDHPHLPGDAELATLLDAARGALKV